MIMLEAFVKIIESRWPTKTVCDNISETPNNWQKSTKVLPHDKRLIGNCIVLALLYYFW